MLAAMISKKRYEALRTRSEANEQAREAFDPKRFAKGGSYSKQDLKAIEVLAGHKPLTNKERGAMEVYTFVKERPDTYVAYYKFHAPRLEGSQRITGIVTTWVGDKLGDIVHTGGEYRSAFRDKRVNIRVRAINGATYAGTAFLDSGDYARLKRTKK
jgi:hypothetical protein